MVVGLTTVVVALAMTEVQAAEAAVRVAADQGVAVMAGLAGGAVRGAELAGAAASMPGTAPDVMAPRKKRAGRCRGRAQVGP